MRVAACWALMAAELIACQGPRAGTRSGRNTDAQDFAMAREALREEGLDFDVERIKGPAGAHLERWVHGTTQVLLHRVSRTPAFVIQRWWFGGPPSLRAADSAMKRRPGAFGEHAVTDVFLADDLAYAQLTSPLTVPIDETDMREGFSAWLNKLPVGPKGPLVIAAVGGLPRTALLTAVAREGEALASGAPDLPTPTTRPLDALAIQLGLSPVNLSDATRLEVIGEILGDPRDGPLTQELRVTGAQWVEVEIRATPDGAELIVRFGPVHAVSGPAAVRSVTRALAAVARGDTPRSALRRAITRLRRRRATRWARAEGRARMMAEAVWTHGRLAVLAEQDTLIDAVEETDLRAPAQRLLSVPAQVRP